MQYDDRWSELPDTFCGSAVFSSMTDTYTDYILDFLASQGVDTSREFVINGTHCELVNGKYVKLVTIMWCLVPFSRKQ